MRINMGKVVVRSGTTNELLILYVDNVQGYLVIFSMIVFQERHFEYVKFSL